MDFPEKAKSGGALVGTAVESGGFMGEPCENSGDRQRRLRLAAPHPKSRGSPLSGGSKTVRGGCACVKVIRLDSCDVQGTIFLARTVAFLSPWPQLNKDLRSQRPGWSLGGSGATRKTSGVSICLRCGKIPLTIPFDTFKFVVVYLNDKVMYYFKETFSTGEDELNPLQ